MRGSKERRAAVLAGIDCVLNCPRRWRESRAPARGRRARPASGDGQGRALPPPRARRSSRAPRTAGPLSRQHDVAHRVAATATIRFYIQPRNNAKKNTHRKPIYLRSRRRSAAAAVGRAAALVSCYAVAISATHVAPQPGSVSLSFASSHHHHRRRRRRHRSRHQPQVNHR